MQDEIEEVLRLVAQPLKSSIKLLNGECKFSVNSSLLYKINKVLDVVVNDTADIILSEWQIKQLHLLLNLINNVPKLVITQRSAESYENVINITRFKRLRYLELCRLCLELVTGLESLKIQLETFICNRCTKYTGFLCKQKELEWPELKFLDLRFMKLDSTNSRFFISKPWIQVLDLSFNRLTAVEGLEYLENLTCLNISYNHLVKVPEISKEAERRLEMLVLNNNHISSLAGVEHLVALKYLFVNNNFICNKSELLHFNDLRALTCLHIENNPITKIKYWNIYLASSLSKDITLDKFLLNNDRLGSLEKKFVSNKFGTCRHWQSPNNVPSTSTALSHPEEVSKYRRPGKRISRPREVVIEDIPSDELAEESQQEKKEVEKNKEKEIDFISEVFSANTARETSKETQDELMEKLVKPEDVPSEKEIESENAAGVSSILTKEKVADNSEDNCQDSDIETTTMLISASVHAPDNISVDIQPDLDNSSSIDPLETKSSEENVICEQKNILPDEVEIKSPEVPVEGLPQLSLDTEVPNISLGDSDSNKNLALSEFDNNHNKESTLEDSDEFFSDIEDEVFWQVQSEDKASGKLRNLILVLLDDELKERSTENGHTITRWPLEKIQSCIKTKIDPVTVEIEFDTSKKDKQFRIYIMEYPDAQVLLKKVYSVLESKPLSSMNQKTYECIKCGSFFVHSAPSAFKTRDTLISCAVCSSTLVIEVEEPKLPEIKAPPISHSSSQSSIGKGSILGEESASKNWKSCSAASLEQNNLLDRRLSTPQRYESDIEVISNPSQSSIEVLGEHSRSVTPRRKISTEEKTAPFQINSQLTTVIEVTSPFANLTESSSSGSLTESVITAYEAFNSNKKTVISEAVLAEEESSPTAEPDPPSDVIEEVKPVSVWRKDTDIYSFTDFTDVDPRIKLFLYQNLFQDDNEALLVFVKCHLWRTGGSDYDGCAVFTTSKIYFLSHSRTNFKVDVCDWLNLFDSFNLKDIKDITPLIWLQGVRVQFKHISYLILIMDPNRTINFLKHLRGFLKGVKIQSNANSNVELSLQQAVLFSSAIERSIDPIVNAFTLCLSITVLKDNVETEIFRLGGLILTSGEFHVIAGELSWFITNSTPSIVASQQMSYLMEVGRGRDFVSLHFLDQTEAVEEVWRLKLISDSHVSYLIDSIRTPWEEMFSESLEVTIRS